MSAEENQPHPITGSLEREEQRESLRNRLWRRGVKATKVRDRCVPIDPLNRSKCAK